MRDPAHAPLLDPSGAARRTLLATAAALLATGRPPPARASSGGPVRVAGTGGAIGTLRALAEAYRRRDPAVEVRILPNLGTSGGIAAMLEGVADIALAGRPLTAAERAAGAHGIPYARTPIAFATKQGGAATARAMTLDDIARIHTGELAEWPDGAPIRLVRRPSTEADTMALAAVSPAMARAVAAAQRRPGLVTAGTDQDNAEALETIQGSFGAITLAQFLSERRRLDLMALDGVEPTPEAVAAGRYPLSKTFLFVTGAEPAPAAAAFMRFVAGPEGGAILTGLGQEPVGGGRGGSA